ncbi:MAG: hypothetical protein FWJ70_17160 [Micromonosporaceae bacterium]|jgi:signal transduction histidine kinase
MGTSKAGVADRVHALGGAVNLDTAPGRGTRLAVTIPVATWEPVP